ncbi:HipA domain-containing protein [Pseudorhodobacter sp. W20_MBD10_FR17]|uniref:HipA domain-containing protein n=1 Tax=Pseudorhodobacter sp. W20_MBD10_FR17 TaxID=3240266 RepID=UPI003F9A8628
MDVWLEQREAPVGLLTRKEDKSLTFVYAPDVTKEHQISLSLPITGTPYTDASCRGYFANLLFEGPQLDKVVDSFQLDRDDYGSMLFHLGVDCPGAISVTPEGTGPGKKPGRFPQDYELILPERLSGIVKSLHMHKRMPEGERDPSPIAGVQGKIAVLSHDGDYYLPVAGSRAPTTHILKVSPVDDPQITLHEAALLNIADAVGISAAVSKPLAFTVENQTINAILSTRFDRDAKIKDGQGLVTRVHAEDFCQALGLPPSLKYERGSSNPGRKFSAGGIGQIASQASVPLQFMNKVVEHIFFNLLVGNSDNHGKNGSILHQDGGTMLAPLYDVVPVFMDRKVTHQLAFDHSKAQFAEDFSRQNLVNLMVELGFRSPNEKRLIAQISRLARAIAKKAINLAPKSLGDGLYAQAMVLEDALDVDFELQGRDFFDRLDRDGHDERPGGWGGLS